MAIQQLLREWPPGYGGVERVAHELGNCWGGVVFSLDVQRDAGYQKDSLRLHKQQKLSLHQGVGRHFLPLPLVTDLSFGFF